MKESWQTLSEEELDRNPWWTHLVRRFLTPDGRTGTYHLTRHANAVNVFARAEDGRFVMVREYRYLFDRISISQPMGGIEPGESPEAAVIREMREESGYEAATLVEIATYATAPSFSQEEFHVFYASDLKKIGDHDLEIEEVILMTAGEIDEAILHGEIWDSNVVCSWYLVKLHLGL